MKHPNLCWRSMRKFHPLVHYVEQGTWNQCFKSRHDRSRLVTLDCVIVGRTVGGSIRINSFIHVQIKYKYKKKRKISAPLSIHRDPALIKRVWPRSQIAYYRYAMCRYRSRILPKLRVKPKWIRARDSACAVAAGGTAISPGCCFIGPGIFRRYFRYYSQRRWVNPALK